MPRLSGQPTYAPESSRAESRSAGDWACVAVLVVVAAAFVRWKGDFSRAPWEDAAMLLRYSQNLAAGHGFVWNVGGEPVDGATDFLFMLVVALVHRLGVGLAKACRAIGLVFHLATVLLTYVGIRSLARAARAAALFGGAYIALGPGVRYIEGGFGTTVFAFFVATSSVAWVAVWRDPGRPGRAALFGLSCLMMGLARPEGVALSLLLFASLMPLIPRPHWPAVALPYGLTFGVPGAIYFAWHWIHFGYPLPNPIYVRAVYGGHVTSFRDATRNALVLLLPLAPLAVVQLLKGNRRLTLALALPPAVFVALWLVLSHSMNFGMRYQYALVPLAFITWAPAAASLLARMSAAHRTIALAVSAILAMSVLAVVVHKQYGDEGDGRRDIGLALSDLPHSYTIVTTEAGLMPLYSEWQAIDAWGLNDSWIAHHGLSDEYLGRSRPALIVFMADSNAAPRFQNVTAHLETFARARRYVFSAAYGESLDAALVFYVAPWVEDPAGLADRIRRGGAKMKLLAGWGQGRGSVRGPPSRAR